jgi:phage repressor protein C with HTH and peptisase S24 domain
MLSDVLERINKRLEAVGLSESGAALKAGLSADAIRNMRRAVAAGKTQTGASIKTLSALAPVLKTSVGWLLEESGAEVTGATVPLMGYMGAGAEIMPDFEQVPPEGLDQFEMPFDIPADLIAFQVRGDSMLPVYHDGHVVFVYREQTRPLEAFFGRDAAVRTSDGRRFIKTVLMSFNAKPIENVRLEWIGEVFATFPPGALRKVERQGGIQGQLRLRA